MLLQLSHEQEDQTKKVELLDLQWAHLQYALHTRSSTLLQLSLKQEGQAKEVQLLDLQWA